jgi:hypothetical protein
LRNIMKNTVLKDFIILKTSPLPTLPTEGRA